MGRDGWFAELMAVTEVVLFSISAELVLVRVALGLKRRRLGSFGNDVRSSMGLGKVFEHYIYPRNAYHHCSGKEKWGTGWQT